MILVDKDIAAACARGVIKIEPYDPKALGTNSYDVHLAPTLRVYWGLRDLGDGSIMPLDCRVPRETRNIEIPEDGYVLQPNELYLASTIEYTESLEHVPMLNGKSSLGRLGLSIHVTAGTGDVGFCNHWTMELFVIRALRVYAGMPIGQLLWNTVSGVPLVPYAQKKSAKYNERSALPMPSEMAKNFVKP